MIHRFTIYLLLCMFMLAGRYPASAQTESGTFVLNALVPCSGTFSHIFSGRTGDPVRADAVSLRADFSPVLALLTLDGSFVGAAEPTPAEPYHARLALVTLPRDGDYLLEVSSTSRCGGDVQVLFVHPRTPELPPEREALIRENLAQASAPTHLTTSIQRNVSFVQSFEARRGDVYTISARALSGTLDPRLALYWQDDLLIAANDDHGSSTPHLAADDARLHRVILPRDGTYHIYVSGYSTSEGEVMLTWGRTARGAPLHTGYTLLLTGSLSETDGIASHPFRALAGDYVTLTARRVSGRIDPRLVLRDPDGQPLFDNDDHGFNDADLDFFDARIASYPIAYSGAYLAQVDSRIGGEGEYTLTIHIARDRRLLDPAYPFTPAPP